METSENWADGMVGRAAAAAEAFLQLDQARVDGIVRAVFEAAFAARIDLARIAHEETGMGLLEHKIIKNAWASLLVYEDIRERPTVGVIADDPASGVSEIAVPKGPILATIPVTNPTSTTIFKALVCMKTRNPVIFSPHRGARKSIREAARICAEAAAGAGAPEHAIQWITKSQSDYTHAIMRHRRVALIVATGTDSIVRQAQVSGRPTLGVGPGNVPVYVHSSADLPGAARAIVHSKTFDNGVVCASEQALVTERDVFPELKPLMEARGAYFCTREESRLLEPRCFDPSRGGMRADVVGQPAGVIAERAGFRVGPNVRLLVAHPEGVGHDHPLSYEILAPVLASYVVDSYEDAVDTCRRVLAHGGVGHTVGVYANDEKVVADFAGLNVARVLLNQPCTEGAIGGIFNALRPSLTLACGPGAGNLNTDNITIEHLINVHRVARFRDNAPWNGVSRATWMDPDVGPREILGRYRGDTRP